MLHSINVPIEPDRLIALSTHTLSNLNVAHKIAYVKLFLLIFYALYELIIKEVSLRKRLGKLLLNGPRLGNNGHGVVFDPDYAAVDRKNTAVYYH